MKVRRKEIIEAARYWEKGDPPPGVCLCGDGSPHVHTGAFQAPVPVKDGDWIMAQTGGGYFRCDPEIFAHTFEVI